MDESCCALVCQGDFFCCEEEWDAACESLAADVCDGGAYCGELGVCCLPTGQCQENINEDKCRSLDGFWKAEGACTSRTCFIGACCRDGGTCNDNVDQITCRIEGGIDIGRGTTCSETTCPMCPGEGDCCSASGGVGCVDTDCCRAVSAIDPSCGSVAWDDVCVSLARRACDGACDDTLKADIDLDGDVDADDYGEMSTRFTGPR